MALARRRTATGQRQGGRLLLGGKGGQNSAICCHCSTHPSAGNPLKDGGALLDRVPHGTGRLLKRHHLVGDGRRLGPMLAQMIERPLVCLVLAHRIRVALAEKFEQFLRSLPRLRVVLFALDIGPHAENVRV
jgi:hypothetical protein